ncbi:MAG: DNA alkylation repair protein [Zoogloeaceae bacterium]|jgi:3-methyladenine DNA glycosylase AlkC|nr:DNA alkylation repair protein [Zoogloeaceae bacterium]
MARKFKDCFDDSYARMLAAKLSAAAPAFREEVFLRMLMGQLDNLEFSGRVDRIARALDASLPGAYAEKLSVFAAILGAPLATETGMFTEGWWLWPIARYVEHHATEDCAASVAFIRELTRRHTGEFAVRPLLKANPETMMRVMLAWSRDVDVHVRRLASEGVRIRLPWARKLTVALERFGEFRALLANLKDDPSRFVQKSVGNNLNDLFKEAPDKAAAIIRDWEAMPCSRATQWIIRHGSRNLKK